MPRPKVERTICGRPARSMFKPNGIPARELEHHTLLADEFEALRLVDHIGMQQIQAAEAMGVSRQTLANIVKSARFKVADCLLQGKALVMAESNEHGEQQ